MNMLNTPALRCRLLARGILILLTTLLLPSRIQANEEPSYAHERTDWTTRELGRKEAREWVVRARPYALMSELAYQGSRINACRKNIQERFREDLQRDGWRLMINRVDPSSLNEDSPGLHFYIWEKRSDARRHLVFAFRGTEFNDGQDWRANLRWFLPFFRRTDQYAQAHQHVLQYLRDNIAPGETNVLVTTTGHSLGGGLAQGMFYASYVLPPNCRITQCYAFDPSPVTGAFQIGTGKQRKTARAARNALQKQMASDKVRGESSLNHFEVGTARIYEQGEILSYIRGPLRRLWPLHSLITEVRFDMTREGNGINQHGMTHLADALFHYRPTD